MCSRRQQKVVVKPTLASNYLIQTWCAECALKRRCSAWFSIVFSIAPPQHTTLLHHSCVQLLLPFRFDRSHMGSSYSQKMSLVQLHHFSPMPSYSAHEAPQLAS